MEVSSLGSGLLFGGAELNCSSRCLLPKLILKSMPRREGRDGGHQATQAHRFHHHGPLHHHHHRPINVGRVDIRDREMHTTRARGTGHPVRCSKSCCRMCLVIMVVFVGLMHCHSGWACGSKPRFVLQPLEKREFDGTAPPIALPG